MNEIALSYPQSAIRRVAMRSGADQRSVAGGHPPVRLINKRNIVRLIAKIYIHENTPYENFHPTYVTGKRALCSEALC